MAAHKYLFPLRRHTQFSSRARSCILECRPCCRLKRPLRRLLSVAFAPFAAFLPLSHAIGIGVRPVMAQEDTVKVVRTDSCFTGVDYSILSYEELANPSKKR